MISTAELNNLVALKQAATEAGRALREAVAETAERHQMNEAALRRYVAALAQDNVSKLTAEARAIDQLALDLSAPQPTTTTATQRGEIPPDW